MSATEYRQWMTMPKLMVSGGSDEFFMPDDYDYFFNDLIGEKYIW
jgi:PhoPQ-activated pathogenicity-related protein